MLDAARLRLASTRSSRRRPRHRSTARDSTRLASSPRPRPSARRSPSCARSPTSNTVRTLADRPRLLRHHHARRDQAQRAREPELVHGLHAVPARDLAGPPRGAHQLPDHGRRPHRARHRERVDARRGHRRRRGHAARPSRLEVRVERVPRRRGRLPADQGAARAPRRGRRHRARRARPRASIDAAPTLPDAFGVFVQYPGASGRVWDPSRDHRGRQGARAASRSSRPTCSPSRSSPRPASSAPTSPSARASASACRWASAARTPATWPCAPGLERQLPGRLVGVSQDADGPPRLPAQPAGARAAHPPREGDVEHLHRAGAARRHGRRCTRSTTAPRASRAIATRSAPARRDARRRAQARAASTLVQRRLLRHDRRCACPDRAASVVERAAHEPRLPAARRRRGHRRRLASTRPRRATTSRPSPRRSALLEPRRDVASHAARRRPASRERSSRTSDYLTHPVFNTHRSETSMMRYLKHLADYDYALDRGMIPLGSCTMKLNAATEMEAVTWPEFAGMHPFAPRGDVEGYLALIEQLETWLAEVTGYDSVSLQPNAGSQGELAGPARDPRLPPSRTATTSARSASSRRARTARTRPRAVLAGHEGRRRRVRRARQRRPRRPAREDRRARRRRSPRS